MFPGEAPAVLQMVRICNRSDRLASTWPEHNGGVALGFHPAYLHLSITRINEVAVKSAANDWNGKLGGKWAQHRAWLDSWLEPFGQAALRAAAPVKGEHVLDIGCGAGASTAELAEFVGTSGAVLGVDISQALITEAQALHSAPQLGFRLADASRGDLDDVAPVDLIFSRFGVMFFDEPLAAFARLRERLKPGGRLAFVCWQAEEGNDWAQLPLTAIKGIVPTLPSRTGVPGPFAFGDADYVNGILNGAGFTNIQIKPFEQTIPFGRGATKTEAVDNALAMAFEVGPLSRALKDQPQDVRDRATDAVRAAFERRAGPTSVEIIGATWIVTANRP